MIYGLATAVKIATAVFYYGGFSFLIYYKGGSESVAYNHQ